MDRIVLCIIITFILGVGAHAQGYLQTWIEPNKNTTYLYSFACVLGVSCIYVLKNKNSVKPKPSKFVVQDSVGGTPEFDVIIVGAGVVGAALGAALQHVKQCRKAVIIEQNWNEPKRIVGELLQPGGVKQLQKLGLQASLKGIDAQAVSGYGIFMGNQKIKVNYPDNERGMAFHNGRFVMGLRKLARNNPRLETREGVVKKLLYADNRVTGVEYQTKDGQVQIVRASLTIVCDGCFSLLRSPLTSVDYTVRSKFLGLILKNVKLPFGNMGHVILGEPTPTLAYPISSNEARMLIDFPQEIPSASTGALQKHLLTKIMPQLPAEIRDSFKDAVLNGGEDDGTKITFMSMPNRSLPARALNVPGTLVIGDALNMRHPLTGGGMTVGLTDVSNFISCFKKIDGFQNQETVTRSVAKFYEVRRNPATSINILADALYQVFSLESGDLRTACFAYLEKGGWYCHGPVSLLSGLSRNQWTLMHHFFAVAFFGVGRELLPCPTPTRVLKAFRILRRAVEIIIPLIETENKFQPYGFGFLITCFCRFSRFVFWV